MANKPIFSRNKDHKKIAFLHWRIEHGSEILNLFSMGEGFLLSSIELANQCLLDNENYRADALIFPILANATHGIELYLKGIIWTINEIQQSNLKTEKGHNIKQLYDTTKSKIKIYGGKLTLKEYIKETSELSYFINELFTKINPVLGNDKMDFARYPFTRNYEDHFYVGNIITGKGHEAIVNLENFISVFKLINNKLEQVTEFLYFEELQPMRK